MRFRADRRSFIQQARAFLADEEGIALALPPLRLFHEILNPLIIKQESLVVVAVQSLSRLKHLALLFELIFGLRLQALRIYVQSIEQSCPFNNRHAI